jgi:adenosylcobinamide-GDP ribazoletransferase
MTRGLIIAMQFLTRVPMPALAQLLPEEFAASARWFPLVGVLIGASVMAAMLLGALIDPWLGALLGLIVWIGITGALHLDGLADFSDALGAAHRDPQRFLAVLRDPHIGTFGAIALVLAIVSKLVLLQIGLADARQIAFAVVLIPAWARFGTLVWSARLPSLSEGYGERFAWRVSHRSIVVWGCLLCAAGALLAPILLIAPILVWSWELYLRKRLGGMTGDCLGAGIELVEIGLLLAVVCAESFPT